MLPHAPHPPMRRLPLSLSRVFRVATGLPRETLFAALKGSLLPPSGVGGSEEDGPFVGTADGEGFSIVGFRDYRSSYLPAVTGFFEPGFDGTDIRLMMRPHREVLIFLSIWFSFLFLVFAMILLASIRGAPSRLLFLALPAAVGVATWVLTSSVFDSNCRWTLRIFREALAIPPGGDAPAVSTGGDVSGSSMDCHDRGGL
jgi:hypothetical protein